MVRGSGVKVMGIDNPYGGPLAYANMVGLSLEVVGAHMLVVKYL